MQMTYRQHLVPEVSAGQVRWLAALLSLGTAGVHFAVAPEHFAEYWFFGWFFVVVAWLQAVWAVAVTSRPTRMLLVVGLVSNFFLVAIWLWTRLIGVPLGPGAGDTESFGWTDGLTVILEMGVVTTAALMLLPLRFGKNQSTSLVAIVLVSSVLLVALIGVVLADASDGGTSSDSSPTSSAPAHHH